MSDGDIQREGAVTGSAAIEAWERAKAEGAGVPLITPEGLLFATPPPVIASIGNRSHDVPDEIIQNGAGPGLSIRDQLNMEIGRFWEAYVIRSNGEVCVFPSKPYMPWIPDGERREYLLNVVIRANADLAHGGFWVGAWDNPSHFRLMHFNRLGKMTININYRDTFRAFLINGIDKTLEVAEKAWERHLEYRKAWDLTKQECDNLHLTGV